MNYVTLHRNFSNASRVTGVAHELRNEGDLSADHSVGPWADLARSHARAAELGLREREPTHDHVHEL